MNLKNATRYYRGSFQWANLVLFQTTFVCCYVKTTRRVFDFIYRAMYFIFSSSFYRDRKKTKVQFGFVFVKISINQEKTRTMAFSR